MLLDPASTVVSRDASRVQELCCLIPRWEEPACEDEIDAVRTCNMVEQRHGRRVIFYVIDCNTVQFKRDTDNEHGHRSDRRTGNSG